MASIYDDSTVRDAVFDGIARLPDLGFNVISTMGSGPFRQADFDSFLIRFGYEPTSVDDDTTALVLGTSRWNQRAIKRLLHAKSGEQLWIYSQEMFITYMLSGVDPLEDQQLARSMAVGHPALMWLESVGFDWPSTVVFGGGNTTVPGNWREIGFLKSLGYTVGRWGLPEHRRRMILKLAYETPGPPVFEREYLDEWGSPQSARRLRKMAQSIAAFCRNQKRSPSGSRHAIRDWEADLRWLRDTFYDGRYQFQWPSTEVW